MVFLAIPADDRRSANATRPGAQANRSFLASARNVRTRRDLLSTLTVTNILDSGAGSLRAEIAAARAGDTIVFAPILDGQTITLTSGELDVACRI